MPHTYRGQFGAVRFEGPPAVLLGGVLAYTVATQDEALETTTIQDTWRTYAPGLTDWNGSMRCRFDNGTGQNVLLAILLQDAAQSTLGDVQFRVGVDDYLHGTVVLTGATVSADLGQVIEATYTFTGDGPLLLGPLPGGALLTDSPDASVTLGMSPRAGLAHCYRGQEGYIYFLGLQKYLGAVLAYTVVVDEGVLETTRMRDPWRLYEPSLIGWNGTMRCRFDNADGQADVLDILLQVQLQGTLGIVEFRVGEWCLSGQILVTGGQVTADLGSIIEATYTFTGNGPLLLGPCAQAGCARLLAHPTMAQGLAHCWDFDEVTGPRADHIGTLHLQEAGGVVASGPGKVGQAARFTGGNWLMHPTGAPNFVAPFTFAFWIWLDTYPTGESWVCLGQGNTVHAGGYYFYCVVLDSNVGLAGLIEVSLSTGFAGVIRAATPVPLHGWHLVMCWSEAMAAATQLQIDQEAIVSVPYGIETGPGGLAGMTIGSMRGTSRFQGMMDLWQWWDRGLSATERALVWNAGRG